MKRLVVSDIFDLAHSIYNNAHHNKEVYAVLFFEEAEALMRELLAYDDVNVGCIEIWDAAFNDYSQEYYVCLDQEMTLWVQKAYDETADNYKGKYLGFEADKVYVDGRANYSIVKAQYNEDCEFIEVTFTDEVCPPHFELDDEEDEPTPDFMTYMRSVDKSLKSEMQKMVDLLDLIVDTMEEE